MRCFVGGEGVWWSRRRSLLEKGGLGQFANYDYNANARLVSFECLVYK